MEERDSQHRQPFLQILHLSVDADGGDSAFNNVIQIAQPGAFLQTLHTATRGVRRPT
jgi:hypothetical protein